MARLHVLSDLHLEFGPFTWPKVSADVTLLAGDTWTEGRLIDLHHASDRLGRPVVAIAGNHEFYGREIDAERIHLRKVAAKRGVTWLERDACVVAGARILGATLWTDFRLFAGEDPRRLAADIMSCERDLNDFFRISFLDDEGYVRRFRAEDAIRKFGSTVSWLERQLAEPFDGPTVVMTHHLPSARCVSRRFAKDPISAAYASRLDWLVERYQPNLWVFGHTHDSFDFSIGRTRMLCNPRGYVAMASNKAFDPTLTVVVGE